MKLGMNLLLWTSAVTEEHFPVLAELKETGFDGVEIPIGAETPADPAALARELDRLGLGRTAVTALPAEANPASPDADVRRVALERLSAALETTAELGCEVLCGPYHSAYAVFAGRGPTADERAWSAEVLHAAAQRAQELGVTMAIEFLNRFECYLLTTPEDARELVRRVGHPALGMHYDTHHAHIEVKDPAAAIAACAEELAHVHVSENDRGTPGSGQVDWETSFRALRGIGYDGWLVIEAFSTRDPEFAAAIHVWRDFAPSARELQRAGHRFVRAAWEAAG